MGGSGGSWSHVDQIIIWESRGSSIGIEGVLRYKCMYCCTTKSLQMFLNEGRTSGQHSKTCDLGLRYDLFQCMCRGQDFKETKPSAPIRDGSIHFRSWSSSLPAECNPQNFMNVQGESQESFCPSMQQAHWWTPRTACARRCPVFLGRQSLAHSFVTTSLLSLRWNYNLPTAM